MLPRTPQNRTRIDVFNIQCVRNSHRTLLGTNSNVEKVQTWAHTAEKLRQAGLPAVMAITKKRIKRNESYRANNCARVAMT